MYVGDLQILYVFFSLHPPLFPLNLLSFTRKRKELKVRHFTVKSFPYRNVFHTMNRKIKMVEFQWPHKQSGLMMPTFAISPAVSLFESNRTGYDFCSWTWVWQCMSCKMQKFHIYDPISSLQELSVSMQILTQFPEQKTGWKVVIFLCFMYTLKVTVSSSLHRYVFISCNFSKEETSEVV